MRVAVIAACLAALAGPALAQPAAGRRPALRLPQREAAAQPAAAQTPPPLPSGPAASGPAAGRPLVGPAPITGGELTTGAPPLTNGFACVTGEHFRGRAPQYTSYWVLRSTTDGYPYYIYYSKEFDDPLVMVRRSPPTGEVGRAFHGPVPQELEQMWAILRAAWAANRPVFVTLFLISGPPSNGGIRTREDVTVDEVTTDFSSHPNVPVPRC